jgi:hypothetical protein
MLRPTRRLWWPPFREVDGYNGTMKSKRTKQGVRTRKSAPKVRAAAKARVVSGKRLWAMKQKQQARDHARAASGGTPAEAVLLIRPHRMKGARLEWPDAPLVDD